MADNVIDLTNDDSDAEYVTPQAPGRGQQGIIQVDIGDGDESDAGSDSQSSQTSGASAHNGLCDDPCDGYEYNSEMDEGCGDPNCNNCGPSNAHFFTLQDLMSGDPYSCDPYSSDASSDSRRAPITNDYIMDNSDYLGGRWEKRPDSNLRRMKKNWMSSTTMMI